MSRILTDRERAERLATDVLDTIKRWGNVGSDKVLHAQRRAEVIAVCRRELTAQRKAVQLRTMRSKT